MQRLLTRFSQATPYLVTITAALFFAFELMQLHMMNAIAPMVMKDLNLNAANFGLLNSSYLLADVIFLIPAGMILDRYSTRKVIIIAMLLCILGTFSLAMAPTFALACLARFVSGIGNAFCFLSLVMLISTWFEPKKHAFMIGLVITIGMFGGFVAQAPFSALAEMLSWRNALIVDGFIGIAILALVIALVYDKEAKKKELLPSAQTFFHEFKTCLVNRQNITCGLYTSFMNMPLMIIGAVYGSLFLTQVHGLNLPQASFVISMICVGTIIGSPIFGWLGDNVWNKKGLMAVASFGSIILFSMIMMLSSQTLLSLMTLFLFLGVFTSGQVLGYPLITESAPKKLVGTSMGISAVIIMGLPMFLGPLAGKIMDRLSSINPQTGATVFHHESFYTAFLIFPIGFFIALLLTFVVREKKRFTLLKKA
ncbi:hypothetical protein COB21_05215 [Candidatus Aerophobetes bacterium]|uniref:Major facilitator superfamily (MFS) profile domain-containing protein n=1 Tax=Aerophobetes bacterium TaxID=2030807 RepID=A0A2A4WZW5_UNCAE|nr:MAG: hypothetical protein COB21_05215 [Candidatus Aerophobetes bacterium]